LPRYYYLGGTDQSSRHATGTQETPAIEEIKIGYRFITKAEIRKAIRDIKSGKAGGIDSIAVEMIKADVIISNNLGPTEDRYLKTGARV